MTTSSKPKEATPPSTPSKARLRTPIVPSPGPTPESSQPAAVPFVKDHGAVLFRRRVFAGRVKLSQIRAAGSFPELFHVRRRATVSPVAIRPVFDLRRTANRGWTATRSARAEVDLRRPPPARETFALAMTEREAARVAFGSTRRRRERA